MNLKLSVPSKTFVIGEYVALVGGSCLVASTNKRFELNVKLKGIGKVSGIHDLSPAGRYLKKYSDDFQQVDIDFVDPYDGMGGLGASSSQFVLLHSLRGVLNNSFNNIDNSMNPHLIWNEYRDLHSKDEGWMPSGADVVAQFVGGLCGFQWKPFRVDQLTWNFENLSFLIFKTNNKIATHEHLKTLKEFDAESMQEISSQSIQAIKDSDSLQFIKSLQQYEMLLREQKLVCKETFSLIENFKSMQNVLSIKGCGALGADTLFAVCETHQVDNIKSLSQVVGLKFVASEKDLSSGLKIEFNYDFSKKHLYPYKSEDWSTEAEL